MERNETEVNLPPEVLATIPPTTLCSSALSLAWQTLQRPIFNHSIRVFLAAQWLAQKEGSEWAQPDNLPLLFVACVCHDLGTSDKFNGPQRFEVEGADAAHHHCQSHGISREDSHKVWTAIAVHTSPGIAERMDSFSRLVRFGVMMDFSLAVREEVVANELFVELEKTLPRLDIERVLADAVVNQANEAETSQRTDNKSWFSTHKFPIASWPGILLRARLQNSDHVGRNPAF
ncbi:hypothetical protein J3459_017820 [Metarhizium acridum]|nr:hypothetical protein J3459_017820 [Metarhizium acridum]